MADTLSHPSPGVFAVRGAIALVFGVLALAWPGITLLVLVALFAAYALISGAATTVGALRRRGGDGWKLALALGLVSVVVGILAALYPSLTLLVLVLLMGVNALVAGAIDIALAIRLRKAIRGEWMLALAGVVSVGFGLLVIALPAAGAVALVWLVAFYAILTGVLLLAHAWRTRRRLERAHG